MNTKTAPTQLDQLCVNTIRTLSMDAVQKANSGHPGMPMGMADAAYVLWTKFLKHNPENADWFDRDRFILSAGHGSMLLYSLLHLTGYDVTLEDLKNFRQWGSNTPGHPEVGVTSGVETTTGPLGQGFGTGVGMAMAEAHLAARFNTNKHQVVDHYTYGIVSDGDLMEGISHESASMAGHMQLGKLIYLYDANRISIDGSTDLAFTEDVAQRFKAYDWHVQTIDGHDHTEIEAAIIAAQASEKPSLIICKTHIGFGSPNKQDDASSHGAPLGEDEIAKTKENLGWPYEEPFVIPDEVLDHFRTAVVRGKNAEQVWARQVDAYKRDFPEQAAHFTQTMNRSLPAEQQWDTLLPNFEADEKGMATRKSSGQVLNAIADAIPQLIGGSADLTGSNKTFLDNQGIFSTQNYEGRNIHFGVREHGMSAAVNGMALHKGVIPYCGTFFVFTDYSRPAIRLAALSHIPSIFVLTHDSVGLGEDGPTHQPIAHLASFRAMPNVTVLRPADANEVAAAWKVAIEEDNGPTLLVLTRQNLPTLAETKQRAKQGVDRGAYILADSEADKPDIILMGTGSEISIAYAAHQMLLEEGVNSRVVSMPSWERFRNQPESYREEVLPETVQARVSIEAGATQGWSEWTGNTGINIGIDKFGASAPYQEIFKHYGLTPEAVVSSAKSLLEQA
jgi:transketolase